MVASLPELLNWIAPAATIAGAMLTAASLGARVTGLGFGVLAAGSAGWSLLGAVTNQPALLWTNLYLLLVNGVGCWRWLGRHAAHERAAHDVEAASAAAPTPTLFSQRQLQGVSVDDSQGERVGQCVDIMVRTGDARPDYVVVELHRTSERKLVAVPAALAHFGPRLVTIRLPALRLWALDALDGDQWPVRAPVIHGTHG